MQLRVRILPAGREKVVDLAEGSDGFGLMESLTLNPEAHIIIREDRPIPVDEELRDGDRLSVVSVISGG